MDSPILPAGLMLLLAALPTSADILHVDASVSGGAGNGSSWSNAYADLQQALSAASPGDTIQLAAGVYYPDINSGTNSDLPNARFLIDKSLTLLGGYPTGGGARDIFANRSILSGDITQNDPNDDGNFISEAPETHEGPNSNFILRVEAGIGGAVIIDGLTITAGDVSSASGSDLAVTPCLSPATFKSCTFRGNQGIALGASNVSLTIDACTFANNAADHGAALWVFGSSSTTVNRSTFSNNSASVNGGGIFVSNSAGLTLNHCTLSGNSAVAGGGIYMTVGSSLSLLNSIVAGNTANSGADVLRSSGTALTTNGANLIGDNATVASSFPTGPLAGTTAEPIDPALLDLGYFGGTTESRLPLFESAAIDAALPSSATLDQRDRPRSSDGSVPADASSVPDLGSTELSIIYINTTVDENDGPNTGNVSLRDAIASSEDAAVFDPAVFPLVSPPSIQLIHGPLQIQRSMGIGTSSIDAEPVHVKAQADERVFVIDDGRATQLSTVALQFLEITDGHTTDVAGGGNILNQENLILYRTRVLGGRVTSHNARGGGISNGSGSLLLYESQFQGNIAGSDRSTPPEGVAFAAGGAIFSESGPITAVRCMFKRNAAVALAAPFGIPNTSGNATIVYGGAITSLGSNLLTAYACSFSFNMARGNGSDLIVDGDVSATSDHRGGAILANQAYLISSTFLLNQADSTAGAGAACYAGAALLVDTTMVGNLAEADSGLTCAFAFLRNSGIGSESNATDLPSINLLEVGLETSPLVTEGLNFISNNSGVESLLPASPLVGTEMSPRAIRIRSPFTPPGQFTEAVIIREFIDKGMLPDETIPDQFGESRPVNGMIDIGALEIDRPLVTSISIGNLIFVTDLDSFPQSLIDSIAASLGVSPDDLVINLVPSAPASGAKGRPLSNPYTEEYIDTAIDSDGDGVSDTSEILSGTDISDPSDFLRIESIARDPSNLETELMWKSRAGTIYTIESSPDLNFDPLNLTISPEIFGDESIKSFTETLAGEYRFFRLRAEPIDPPAPEPLSISELQKLTEEALSSGLGP